MEQLLITLTISIFLLNFTAAEVPGVDSYWNEPGVGRYRRHTELTNYTDAIKECEKEDAHLALPTSKGAEDVMLSIVRSVNVSYSFVGVNDITKEGEMVTVKGELYSKVGFTSWRYNRTDETGEEDCVIFSWNAMLNDFLCSTPTPFICEKNRSIEVSMVQGVDRYRNVLNVGSYRLHTEVKNYTDAMKECDKEDAHLALPTSKEAQEVMLEILASVDVSYAFVGINDLKQEGQMVTVTGKLYSEVGYTPFLTNQPDNHNNDEDCVTFTSEPGLNDRSCSIPVAFFCELNRLVPHEPY